MQTKTPGNKRYALTLIDDCSRYITVHLLEHKSEVTERIQDFVRNMKTRFNKAPQAIRSDRGKEYINSRLKDFLRKEGIDVQYTVGYAPEQNGTAERKNRHLMEMARCMLIDGNLPNKYWGEAICTANYIQNRLYTKATGTTPFERWYKKKPSLQHMHTFGSKVYAHVPKELRRKLDSKARELIFVGYAEDAKGYRLLNPSTDKVIISRDVNFLDKGDESNEIIIQRKEIQKDEEEVWSQEERKFSQEEREPSQKEKESSSQEEEKITIQEENDILDDQQIRRSQRENEGVPPDRYCNLVNCMKNEDTLKPDTYEEAMSSPDNVKWIQSMNEEYNSLMNACTWTLVDKPMDRNIIGCKWIYKMKTDAEGQVMRYKARLVAQGYAQEDGVDYEEVFAPVSRQTIIHSERYWQ